MKKNICVFTTTRADYSLLKNLVLNLQKIKKFKTTLVVSGTHLSKRFGYTLSDVRKDKIKNIKKIKIDSINKSGDYNLIFNETFKRISSFLKNKKIDLVIILGDRFETLAISIPCFLRRIPICHLHGGEKTLGSIDNNIRNAITSISKYHFTANEDFKNNVKKIVGNSLHVESVGAMFLDNLSSKKKVKKENIEKKFNFKFKKKNMIVTLHPETLSKINEKKQIQTVLNSLVKFKDVFFIFTAPNIDYGSKIFFKEIKSFVKKNINSVFIKSLGDGFYHSIIGFSDGVLGNSSSGIIEVPYFRKGTINIGDRQKGRPQEKTIINTTFSKSSIIKSIKKLYSKKFQLRLRFFRAKNYGRSGAAKKIVNRIKYKFIK